MAEITVELIKNLRDKTNAGMMDCKGALVEAGGDLEAAETILRKKGIAAAGKKSERTASEGVIAAAIVAEGRVGVLAEVNSETDFVAKNENFTTFVSGLTGHLAASEASDLEAALAEDYSGDEDGTLEDVVNAKIGNLGENIVLRRFDRFSMAAGSHGVVTSYIHLAGKVGVLLEVSCEKADTEKNEDFRELAKDITLHIAAAQPTCVTRDEVSADLIAKEKEIYADQVKGKPAEIIEKILVGKIDKFLSTICLLEQGFIKDPDQTIEELIKARGAEIGDAVSVRRFVRYAIGEEI